MILELVSNTKTAKLCVFFDSFDYAVGQGWPTSRSRSTGQSLHAWQSIARRFDICVKSLLFT